MESLCDRLGKAKTPDEYAVTVEAIIIDYLEHRLGYRRNVALEVALIHCMELGYKSKTIRDAWMREELER